MERHTIRLRKGEKLLFFSWLMFLSATSPLVLCMYKFVLNLFMYCYIPFLQARVVFSSIKRISASGWFVRMENNNWTPNISNYLRTFEEHSRVKSSKHLRIFNPPK